MTSSLNDLIDEPTAVYLLFDACDELIYVGMTVNLDMRFGSHAVTKTWWPEVARREIEWYEDRLVAEARETDLIESCHPKHNVLGTPRHALECAERSKAVAARLAARLLADGPPEDPTAELLAALTMPDRRDQARALGDVLNRIPAFATHVRKLRQDVVEKMHSEDGMSWAEIGEAIGQHRNRAQQIARGVAGGSKRKSPPPE